MTTTQTPQSTIDRSSPKVATSAAAPTPLGQSGGGTHPACAERPLPPRTSIPTPVPRINATSGDTNSTVSHCRLDTHTPGADGPDSAADHACSDTQRLGVGSGPNSRQATPSAESKANPPAGSNSLVGQGPIDTTCAGEGSGFPADHPVRDGHGSPVGGESNSGQPATTGTTPRKTSLADPTLALAADVLDDLETVRIANENRLRQLTRSVEDSDGELRGFGLTEADPAVARLAAIVELLKKADADATKNLEKTMRAHPLGPWIKAQRGIGEKQGARLLAAIGDPYWNTLHDRPRTVSELWAYCGYHVLPAGHAARDTQGADAGRVQAGAGTAPCRRRGQKHNWSEAARKRAWLVAKSIVKSGGPYRDIYDATKAKHADALHTAPCIRCGPAGKPALVGSPLSKGHIDARGLRAISKAVLKELWRESKRLHDET